VKDQVLVYGDFVRLNLQAVYPVLDIFKVHDADKVEVLNVVSEFWNRISKPEHGDA